VLQVRGKLFLQIASKIKRTMCHPVRRVNGQQTIRIDGLEQNEQLFCGARDHLRKKKAGEIIRDDNARVFRQRGQKAFSGSWFRFHIRKVLGAVRGTGLRVIRHSI
jgi:hypothetical protein